MTLNPSDSTDKVLIHRNDENRDGSLSFEDLRKIALSEIQANSGRTWSDHNLHDPGITLLEAGIWAIADLNFRIAFASPTAPIDLEEPDTLPLAPQDPAESANALDRFREIQSRLLKGENSHPTPKSPFETAMYRRARRRRIHDSWTKLARALEDATVNAEGTPLSDSELTSIVLEQTGISPTVGELCTVLARLALPIDPVRLETEDGLSRTWPPHPSQLNSIDPVTAHDLEDHLYRRLKESPDLYYRSPRQEDRDYRVWACPGAVCGIRWDGEKTGQEDPGRVGVMSLLLERNDGKTHDAPDQLLEMARRSFEAEVVPTVWHSSDLRARRAASRPIGTELHFGFVRKVVIKIGGTLWVQPNESKLAVGTLMIQCIREHLEFGDYDRDRSTPSGWRPGTPIDLSVLTVKLLEIEGVEAVDSIFVQRVGPLGGSRNPILGPFEIPDATAADLSEMTIVGIGYGGQYD